MTDVHPARAPGWMHALVGVLAAGSALAVGELVTGFDEPGASLVTAVGDEFIDRFAGALKEIAVSLFGTNDKAALVVGIVLVALGIGASIGAAARTRPWVPFAAFAAFGLLGACAYSRTPFASTAIGILGGVLGAAAGLATLQGLLLLVPRPRPVRQPAPATDGVAQSDETGIVVAAAPVAVGGPLAGTDRRTFLVASGAVAGGAVALAAASRRLRGPAQAVIANLKLPPAESLASLPDGQPFSEPGLTPYITPNDDFYRIDTALVVPRVDVDRWRLEVGGRVESPLTLTYDDLLAMEAVEVPVTLQCVSNTVGGGLVGNAVWQGVPLADLLDRVRPREDATQIVGRSVDGFTAGFPASAVGDGRTALVAYAMNGRPLPTRHGFPARLVVAGLYGYVSATKWLSEIELTGWDDFDGYWVPRGWSKEGPVKTASRIDVPRGGTEILAGPVPVAGVAWAPTRGISAVEVRVDDGPWMECQLGRTASDETWVQWWLEWDATPGDHVLTVRAVDGTGEVQTDAVAPPAPDGATGHHARRVTVT